MSVADVQRMSLRKAVWWLDRSRAQREAEAEAIERAAEKARAQAQAR